VTAGTIFHRSRLPLTDWFAAAWFVTSQKTGVSALGLQRALGLGSYETAWSWMHKLCRAMVRPDRDRLDGIVEVDETFVGGLRQVSSEALCAFVGNAVTAGATVRTDGWNVYAPLAETFGHQSIAVSRSGQPAHVVLPGVHRVASLLKCYIWT
jgi:hypothetical protein